LAYWKEVLDKFLGRSSATGEASLTLSRYVKAIQLTPALTEAIISGAVVLQPGQWVVNYTECGAIKGRYVNATAGHGKPTFVWQNSRLDTSMEAQTQRFVRAHWHQNMSVTDPIAAVLAAPTKSVDLAKVKRKIREHFSGKSHYYPAKST
jgi:hypothetical protein